MFDARADGLQRDTMADRFSLFVDRLTDLQREQDASTCVRTLEAEAEAAERP